MKTLPSMPLCLSAFLIFLLAQACAQTPAEQIAFSAYDQPLVIEAKERGNIRAYEVKKPGEKPIPPAIAKQSQLLDQLWTDYQAKKTSTSQGIFYQLQETVSLQGDSYLRVKLETGAPLLVCEVFGDRALGAPLVAKLFPPVWDQGDGQWNFDIPLNQLSIFSGFRVSGLPASAPCSIISAEIKAGNNQTFNIVDRLVPAGLSELSSNRSIQFNLPYYPENQANQPSNWDIFYEYIPGNANIAITMEIVGTSQLGQRRQVLQLRPRPGKQHFYLYGDSLGFTPRTLQINGLGPEFRIISLSRHVYDEPNSSEITDWQKPGFQAPNPLPADIWALLHYSPRAWRQDFMEVFSWNLLPEIKIIDFASLEIQDRFVKRMVFFTEKKGYRGTLQPNSIIDPKHGWNANDFSANSLAQFFTQAELQKFPLNQEELYLRECLVQWGVIKRQNDEYLPGSGGLLSVARGGRMTDLNRSLLLQHEALHGVFFAMPQFQEKCESAFTDMPASARDFMLDYFSFYQYDPQDHELMVNETMAYLLQQSLGAVDSYITVNMVNAYGLVYPNQKKNYLLLAKQNVPALRRTAQVLSQDLFRLTGLANGELACVFEP